jgi:hypothetical protein
VSRPLSRLRQTLSSYRRTATLRLQHSWTRWRLSRLEHRLHREQAWLEELRRLEGNQRVTVALLRERLHPPQEVHLPEPEPEPEPPVDLRLLVPGRPRPVTEIPFEELMEVASQQPMLGPEPPPEEPMPDPMAELSQRLGLPPRQTSSPSSPS